MPPSEPFRLGHRRWLDGLRGVALLAVLAYHLQLLPGGSLGVDIFFVLSGFLITTLLLCEFRDRSTISLRNFYFRRALRLLPAFLILLAVCAVATAVWGEPSEYWEILVAGCYVANWPSLHQTPMPRLGHTWSLSVEEQFYLVWPIALLLLLRTKASTKTMIATVCVGISASAILRLTLYRLSTATDKAITVTRLYMGADTRADALLIGCLAAMLITWGYLTPSARVKKALAFGAAIAVPTLAYLAWNRCYDHSQYYHGLFTVVAGLTAVIILHMILSPSRLGTFVLEITPLVVVGRMSYGLYLYHIPAIAWLKPTGLGWQHPWPTLQVAAATFAAATVSYLLVEQPALKLKRRFESAPGAKVENDDVPSTSIPRRMAG